MRVGVIGLGKMGYNICLNLSSHGHEVVAYDKDLDLVKRLDTNCLTAANSIAELSNQLGDRKVVWIMIPSGMAVDRCIEDLLQYLNKDDIIIDGGNSNYKDSIRRYKYLLDKGIRFLDCGTSGGVNGALNGACTMVGGDKEIFEYCRTVFEDISTENGYTYTGEAGSGHFVKMVHNGIEYGMMQAIAEGFEIMHESDFDLNLQQIAKVWNHGSVVRSWLMELLEDALSKEESLDSIKGIMNSSGEGKWTLEEALDLQIATPVIALSLLMRYRSQKEDTFSGKVVAALRNEFGGHSVEKK